MIAENQSNGTVEGELDKYGVYASVTSGTSMRPLFKTHRDVIIVKKPQGELKKYDVALYRAPTGENCILHRVIGVRDDVYLIRGDNTFFVERVPKDRVIAVLTEFNRAGKRHSVEEFGYKLYSRLWHYAYPFRYLWHALYRLMAKVYRFVFKRKKKAASEDLPQD